MTLSDLVREVHISNNELVELFGGDYPKYNWGKVLEKITGWRAMSVRYGNSVYGSYLIPCPYFKYEKDGLTLHVYPQAVKEFMGNKRLRR